MEKPGIFSLGPVDFSCFGGRREDLGANAIDMERMRLAIEQAKRETDYVVVCFHSHEIKGMLDEEPDYFVEQFCRACIDWGASAVIGSGTHEIKALELYRGKPILYSIANFIFQSEGAQELAGRLLRKIRRSIAQDGSGGKRRTLAGGTRGLETEPSITGV